MSFGWSVGDIVAALQLCNKVLAALKDTGGASSDYQHATNFLGVLAVTLQHLGALQAVPLDPDLAKNLEQHCALIQGPLTSFRERIRTRFERDLGPDSTRLKVLTTGRKLQWALSTAKDVKVLEGKIGGHLAAISIVLSQQVIQTSLQIPAEIQARIAHTIDTAVDTRIRPLTLKVHKEITALSAAEKASAKHIKETIEDAKKHSAAEIQRHSQTTKLDFEQKFSALSISQQDVTESLSTIQDQSQRVLDVVRNQSIESHADSKMIQGQVLDLSNRQSQSTDTFLRAVQKESHKTVSALQKQASASSYQTLSLHQKLDRMNWLMGAVKNRIDSLSMAHQSTHSSASSSELKTAVGNIQRSVWLLVSALHVLIRELIYLLAPYMVAIYRTSVQPLLLYGDHFLFEDAIGRRKWLPCLQFQHWEKFYGLLVDSFQGEAGLPRILNGQFVILNSFNEVPIHKKAWRSGIQPKSRVHMAMILESTAVKKGRCATPSCSGLVDFGKDEITRLCPVCGKHLLTLKDALTEDDEFTTETSFSFDFGSELQIPSLTNSSDRFIPNKESKSTLAPAKSQHRLKAGKPMKHRVTGSDNDIAAFKRVIWQDSDEQLSKQAEEIVSRVNFIRRPPRRTHNAKYKQKSALPLYDRKIEASKVPRWAPIPPTPPILPLPSAPSIHSMPSTPSSPSTPSTDRAWPYDRQIGNEVWQKKDKVLRALFQETKDKTMGCAQCTQNQLACLFPNTSGLRCKRCIALALPCSFISGRKYSSGSNVATENGTSTSDGQSVIDQNESLPSFFLPRLERTHRRVEDAKELGPS